MISLLLTVHIAGALALSVAIVVGLIATVKGKTQTIKAFAKGIAIGSVLELATGAALIATKGTSHSIKDLCLQFGLYLVVIGAAETVMVRALKKKELRNEA